MGILQSSFIYTVNVNTDCHYCCAFSFSVGDKFTMSQTSAGFYSLKKSHGFYLSWPFVFILFTSQLNTPYFGPYSLSLLQLLMLSVQIVKFHFFLILENGVCLFPWNTIIKTTKNITEWITSLYFIKKYFHVILASLTALGPGQTRRAGCHMKTYSEAWMPLWTVRTPGLSMLKQGCT